MSPLEERARVAAGYRRAREVTRRHARSFFFASALLFGARRRAAFALYAFCRRLDDLVDGPAEAPGQAPVALPVRLARARQRVAALYEGLPELAMPGSERAPGAEPAEVHGPWDASELAALAHAVRRYRIPELPFQELISGMEMDLTVHRYATWEALHLYCYRVAGVVGRMMAPVLGCEEPAALSAAEDLGVAMQLTNILRDVAEDLGRGRVYLPADELAAFGLAEADLARGEVDARWRAFLRFQVERARAFYARGAAGVGALRGFGCQRMVRLMGATYGDILRVIEARDGDVFRARAFVPASRKVALALATLVRPRSVLPSRPLSPRERVRGLGTAVLPPMPPMPPMPPDSLHTPPEDTGCVPSPRPSPRGRGRIAVVGGGIGGLTAAGLLARRGLEVTLYEASGALGGKARTCTVDGLTLDTGPTLLTLPHLVRDTFASLGAEHLLPPLTELSEQCRYHFHDGSRLTAFRDVEATAASAAGLHPAEREGVRSFYAEAEAIWRAAGEPYLEAPFEGMPDFLARAARRGLSALSLGMGLGTLDALAARHFRTPQLRMFVGRFATYTGASPFEASAAFALVPHLERAFGVHHVRGGVGALVDALGRAAEAAGVRVRLGARARWERAGQGWRVGPPGEGEPFDAVVVNADPLESLGRGDEPLALSGYVLLLGVEGRAELPHHAVLFGADHRREFHQLFAGQLADDPTVYVCHPAATDATMAPPDGSGLFVMVNAPPLPPSVRGEAGAAEAWREQAARVRAQCVERLLQHFPALRGRLRVLGERTPADLAALGAPGGSIYGFLPHGKLGPFRRPRIRGGAPGLFFAGGGTHPGGGVPLVMLSGRFAAELAASHVGTGARAGVGT